MSRLLASSKPLRLLKMRPKPAMGFRRSGLGASRPGFTLKPTCATDAATPTTSRMIQKGASSARDSLSQTLVSCGSVPASTVTTKAASTDWRRMPPRPRPTLGASPASASRAASSNRKLPSSWLRAT